MSSLAVSSTRTRPVAVTVAVVLSVLLILGNFAGPFLPQGSGDDKVPTLIIVLGIIFGLVGIPVAVELWQLRRWGMILTIILSALNLLSAAPGIVAGPGAGIKILAGIGVLLPAAVIVLVLLPEARRAYR